MKLTKRLSLLLTLLGFCFTAPAAHAGHIGGYLGTNIFTFDGADSVSHITGGFDAAMNLAPNLEVGAFWNHSSDGAQTLVGGELILYPMLYKFLYVEGKLANANFADGNNHLAYGPGAGVNLEVLPMLLSVGVDATYYLYSSGTGMHDIAILGSAKVWF